MNKLTYQKATAELKLKLDYLRYILIYMKAIQIAYFAYTLLLLTFSQDVFISGQYLPKIKFYDVKEGAMLQHYYCTSISIINPQTTILITVNETIPDGIFSKNETIVYATSILAYDFDLTQNRKDATVFVQKIIIHPSRTQYTLYLRAARPEIAISTTLLSISLQIVFIGSDFNKQSSGQLSDAFARNSKLVPVSNTGNQDFVQMDFVGTQNETSPFAFTPTSTSDRACRVSNFGDNAKIQIIGCSRAIFFPLITGFNFQSLQQLIPDDFLMSSYLVSQARPGQIFDSNYIIPTPTLVDSDPNYLYMSDSSDPRYGLMIYFKPALYSKLSKIQISFVFFGLKVYISPITYESITPDNFIVEVGLNKNTFRNSEYNIFYDGLQPSTVKYFQSQRGHSFCGIIHINKRKKVGIFQILPFQRQGVLELSGFLNIPEDNNQNSGFKAGCLFLRKKLPCDRIEKRILSVNFQSNSNSTGITVTDNKLVLSQAELLPRDNYGFYFSSKALYGFTITGYSNHITKSAVSITKQFQIPKNQRQVIFYLLTETPDGNLVERFRMMYNVAGKSSIFYRYTSEFKRYQYFQQTYHLQEGTERVKVNVTVFIESGVPQILNTFIVKMGLFYFDKVISKTLECVSSCSDSTELQVGGDQSNPPLCIFCNQNQTRIYENSQCVCKQGYFQDSNLKCQRCIDPLCMRCNATYPKICMKCSENSNLLLQYEIEKEFMCVCKQGYYFNGSNCVTCQKNAQYKDLNNLSLGCICKEGFYKTQNSNCQACFAPCATCEGLGTTCRSCINEENLILSQTSCICSSGFILIHNKCIEQPIEVEDKISAGIAVVILISSLIGLIIIIAIFIYFYRYRNRQKNNQLSKISSSKESEKENPPQNIQKMVKQEKQQVQVMSEARINQDEVK